MQPVASAIDQWFLMQGNLNIGRVAEKGFAEKSRRSDSDNRKGMTLDIEG